MKKSNKNMAVTTLVAGLFAIFATVSCSSKEQTSGDQASVSAPSQTVASNTTDSANLGAGSSGRGQ